MDLSKIDNIYSCTVADTNILGRTSFTKFLYVPFQPDFVIVKNFHYSPFTTGVPGSDLDLQDIGRTYFVSSDIVPEQFRTPLGHFTINTSAYDTDTQIMHAFAKTSESPVVFKMDKNVSGTYNFKFSDALGADVVLYGTVTFNLEFIKLKK